MGFNPKGVGLLVQIVISLIVLGIIPMYGSYIVEE